jgi:hypothetical protein
MPRLAGLCLFRVLPYRRLDVLSYLIGAADNRTG